MENTQKKSSLLNKIKSLGIKKVIIAVLVILVCISLIPWSSSGFFASSQNNKWIKVGSKSINSGIILSEYNEFIQKNYMYIQQNPMVLAQYLNNLIGQYVSVLLFSNEASSINVTVNDKFLLDLIAKIPAFQKEDGTFDKTKFQSQVKAIFGSEQAFLDTISNNILKDQLLEGVYPIIKEPFYISYLDYLAITQERTIKYIEITPNLVKNTIPKAKDEELMAIAQNKPDNFSHPEYRSAEYIFIDTNSLTSKITITDAEIKSYYEKNIANYMLGETRDVSQIIFNSKSEAQSAYEKIQKLSLDEAKKQYSLINIGIITQEDLSSDISKEVFKFKDKIFNSPIESSVGWHIFYINKIIPSQAKPLLDLKNEIKAELLAEKKNAEIQRVKNDLINALNKNEDLSKNSLWKHNALENISENDKSLSPEIVKVIFTTEINKFSNIEEDTKGNLFAVKIKNVKPKKLKEINEIREDLYKIWYQEKSKEEMLKLASQINLQISEGKNIDSLKYKVSTASISLTSSNSPFDNKSMDIIFDNEKNKAIQGNLTNENLFVGIITTIKNSKVQAKNAEGIRNQEVVNYNNYANQAYVQSFVEQYAKILEGKYKVKVDEQAILKTIAPNSDK